METMEPVCDVQSSQAEVEVQLALRLARIRAAKRRNYVRIVAKHAALLFISNNKKTNMSGTDIVSEKQAQDKKLLQSYFNEILQDTGKYGVIVHDTIDTIYALEKGALDLVIVWEHLPINRVVLRNSATRELTIVHLTPEEEKEKEEKKEKKHGAYFNNGDTGGAFEVILRVPLVEWLAHACKRYSIQLKIVDDMSPEGSRFCREFGGIGGVLHENNGLGALVTGIALDVDAFEM